MRKQTERDSEGPLCEWRGKKGKSTEREGLWRGHAHSVSTLEHLVLDCSPLSCALLPRPSCSFPLTLPHPFFPPRPRPPPPRPRPPRPPRRPPPPPHPPPPDRERHYALRHLRSRRALADPTGRRPERRKSNTCHLTSLSFLALPCGGACPNKLTVRHRPSSASSTSTPGSSDRLSETPGSSFATFSL